MDLSEIVTWVIVVVVAPTLIGAVTRHGATPRLKQQIGHWVAFVGGVVLVGTRSFVGEGVVPAASLEALPVLATMAVTAAFPIRLAIQSAHDATSFLAVRSWVETRVAGVIGPWVPELENMIGSEPAAVPTHAPAPIGLFPAQPSSPQPATPSQEELALIEFAEAYERALT